MYLRRDCFLERGRNAHLGQSELAAYNSVFVLFVALMVDESLHFLSLTDCTIHPERTPR